MLFSSRNSCCDIRKTPPKAVECGKCPKLLKLCMDGLPKSDKLILCQGFTDFAEWERTRTVALNLGMIRTGLVAINDDGIWNVSITGTFLLLIGFSIGIEWYGYSRWERFKPFGFLVKLFQQILEIQHQTYIYSFNIFREEGSNWNDFFRWPNWQQKWGQIGSNFVAKLAEKSG